MPIWKFTQGTAAKSGEIAATVGLSASFDADTPHREIVEQIGLSASFEAELQEGSIAATLGLGVAFYVEQADYGISHTIGIDVSFDAILLVGDLSANLGISVVMDREVEYLSTALNQIGFMVSFEAVSLSDSLTLGVGFGAQFSASQEASRDVENDLGLSCVFDGFNWSDFLRRYGDHITRRYYCTLTGDPDGLEDVVIPIESFQTRIRNGEPTFLSVTIPSLEKADDISDRPNGEIYIEMAFLVAGVEMHREEIVRVSLEDIDIHDGSQNKTIVLSGHKTVTWGVPKTVTISGVNYRRTLNGVTRLRTLYPDMYLKPGDYASYDGDTITVEQITIFVGPTTSTMELAGQ